MKFNEDELIQKFQDFVQTYPTVEEPKYDSDIRKLFNGKGRSLFVDFDDLIKADLELSEEFLENPEIVSCASDTALSNLYTELKNDNEIKNLFFRVYNLPKTTRIKKINVEYIHKLSQVHGMVSAVLSPEPYIK